MYIKYIDLSKKEYEEYKFDEQQIINFEKTNVFIGENNSGKSRLMREILINEYEKVYYVNEETEDFIKLKIDIEKMLEGMSEYVISKYKETYLYRGKFRDKVYRRDFEEENLAIFICNLLYYEECESLHTFAKNKGIIKSAYGFSRDSQFPGNTHKGSLKKGIRELYQKTIENKKEVKPETIYFPSLLSLRKLNVNDNGAPKYNEELSNMFAKNYFSKIKNFGVNIKTGQEIYTDIRKQLLGLSDERTQFLKYEEYISKTFFDSKKISIFTNEADSNVYIKEGNERPYPIYNLGDGLQTLITITYYLYNNSDKPLKVFIDEPEIHLHPGLQRLLILKLQEYTNCQFFISTHSSSMIDICDEYDEDTSIICVEKNNTQKKVRNSEYDDMNLYELIGVRPSSIILSNCTIWVEGPTDIYYIDTFLKMYSRLKIKKEFILGYNYNYAFNGSINIASKIDFSNEETATMKINKISKSNFIIFDSDNMNCENANYEKIQKIKEKLGDRCYVIDSLKTIENIIPPHFLHEYFENNYNPRDKEIKPLVLKFFEKIAKNYWEEEYYFMDIPDEMADYINRRIGKGDIKKYRKYCNNLWKSNKYNLALYFSNKVNEMSQEEQEELCEIILSDFLEMIERIYQFIKENN